MATETNIQNSWLWKYFNRSNNSSVICTICNESCSRQWAPVHLYRSHNIIEQKVILKWNNDDHLIWQHFFKKDLFIAECKFCGYLLSSAYKKEGLEIHIIRMHSQLITAIRKEITRSWVSPHFTFNMDDCSTNCIHCDYNIKTFYGVDVLKNHLNSNHYMIIHKDSEFHGKIRDYNSDATTRQSITEGNNVATSSQDHNIYMGANRRGIQNQ